jgi:phosphoribosyl-ATP pyrophosphohydrolase
MELEMCIQGLQGELARKDKTLQRQCYVQKSLEAELTAARQKSVEEAVVTVTIECNEKEQKMNWRKWYISVMTRSWKLLPWRKLFKDLSY